MTPRILSTTPNQKDSLTQISNYKDSKYDTNQKDYNSDTNL